MRDVLRIDVLAWVLCATCIGCGNTARPFSEAGSEDAGDSEAADASTPTCAFETIDDFDYATAATGLNLATEGTTVGDAIIIVGQAKDNDTVPNNHWLVRMRDAHGMWTTNDDFELVDDASSGATAVASSDTGSVFVAGSGFDKTGHSSLHWVVRRAAHAGATFETVDDFELESDESASAKDIVASGTTLYVGGYARDHDSVPSSHWFVRRSVNGGDDWETVDDFELAPDKSCYVEALALDGSTPYVSGHCYDASANPHWIVRRSTNAGDDWETVDDFVFAPGRDIYARAIATWGGRIYVCGSSQASVGTGYQWFVRSSTTGVAFETIDHVVPEANDKNAYCEGMAANAERVWAVGSTTLVGDAWRVRSALHDAPFADVLTLERGPDSAALDVFFSGSDLVVVGAESPLGGDPQDEHWIVRRRHCEE